MGKADLDTIDESVPSAFEDGEVIVVSWIGDDIPEKGRHGGRRKES
jgi:hypothetical protein